LLRNDNLYADRTTNLPVIVSVLIVFAKKAFVATDNEDVFTLMASFLNVRLSIIMVIVEKAIF
jgi:hypothetical protein